jgi:quercetin dioxygenase-like cupin family protein
MSSAHVEHKEQAMNPQPMIVTPEDHSSSLKVVGEEITVLASGAETGSYEIFLQAGPESVGPPPHSHPWDEAFYVLEGTVEFGIAESVQTAGPGTLVQLPAGTVHWFRLGAGGARMLSITSNEAAAAMFADIDRTIAPGDPDIGELVAVITSHGVSVLPPPD